MNLGDFFSTTASKAGISNDDQALKTFLSDAKLAALEIPDAIVSQIQSNYFTIEAAKNNPTVLAHAKAQIYNGFDSELNRTLEDYKLDDASKQELTLEKSTPKRISLAIRKIAELEKAKANVAGSDKTALQLEIDKLNGMIRASNDTFAKEKSDMLSRHESDLLNYDLTNTLAQYNYSFPKEMDNGLKVQMAKMAIEKALQEKDAKFIRENGALKLKRASQDSDYYDEKNSKMDSKSFLDSVLAQNNLLAVNDNNNTPAQQATTIVTSTKNNNSRSYQDSLDKSMAELEAGSKTN